MSINEYDNMMLNEKETNLAPAAQPGTDVASPAQTQLPTTPPNEYSGIMGAERDDRKNKLMSSMFVASQADPARIARSMQLAKDVGLDVGTVDRNLEDVQKQRWMVGNDYDKMMKETPGASQFMEDPHNAALARDDQQHVGDIDRGIQILPKRDLPNPFMSFAGEMHRAGDTGWNNLSASVLSLGIAFGKNNSREAIEAQALLNKRAQHLDSLRPDYSKEFNAAMTEEGGDVNKAFRKWTSSYDSWKDGKILKAMGQFMSGEAETVAEVLDLIRHAAIRPAGLAYSISENAVNSLPAIGLGAAGAAGGTMVAPGIGTTIGLAGGTFAGEAVTEVGSMINQQFQERGVDITDPDQLEQAYGDPRLMSDIRAQALKKGLTTAAVDALFAMFAGRLTGGAAHTAEEGVAGAVKGAAKKSLKQKAVHFGTDVGVEMAGETIGEASGQVAQKNGDLSQVDWGSSVQEGITSMGQSVATTLTGASARKLYAKSPVAAAQEVAAKTDQAFQTFQGVQALAKVGEAIAGTKNLKEVPSKVAELVEAAGGGPNSTSVYFQSDDWDNYWNKKGESPAEKANEVMGDGGKAYNDAKNTNGIIEVPVEKYAGNLGNTEDFNGLLNVTRVTPDGMSLAEAAEHMKQLPAPRMKITHWI
jgi:hypothetical protein